MSEHKILRQLHKTSMATAKHVSANVVATPVEAPPPPSPAANHGLPSPSNGNLDLIDQLVKWMCDHPLVAIIAGMGAISMMNGNPHDTSVTGILALAAIVWAISKC